jgi:hypothetical protein
MHQYAGLSFKQLRELLGKPNGTCRSCGQAVPAFVLVYSEYGVKKHYKRSICRWYCDVHCPDTWLHDHPYVEWIA